MERLKVVIVGLNKYDHRPFICFDTPALAFRPLQPEAVMMKSFCRA
jgi:hypothetical protein